MTRTLLKKDFEIEKKICLTEIPDLFNGEFDSVKGIEILNTHPNVHNIDFTLNDFENLIENFQEYKDEKNPHLKIAHTDQQMILKELIKKDVPLGEELPKLGRVDRMYVNGDSLLADISDIPKTLKPILFSGKYFNSVSPEILRSYRGTGKQLISAISFTNNPSQKHITDVRMGEGLKFDGNIIIKEEDKKMPDVDKKKVEDIKLTDEQTKGIVASVLDLFKKEKDVKVKDKEIIPGTPEGFVALSELEDLKKGFEAQLNELKIQLVDKSKLQTNFSEEIKIIKENARKESTEAICSGALKDGVPAIVISTLKPILLSEEGEIIITFSEKVDDKDVEVKKSMSSIVKDFFKNYPNKIEFSDKTTTDLEEIGDEKSKALDKRVEELVKVGLSEHEALTRAGQEIL